MELEELKSLWDTHTKAEIEAEKLSDRELHTILQHKTNDIISKIKKNMFIEILFGVISMVVLIRSAYINTLYIQHVFTVGYILFIFIFIAVYLYLMKWLHTYYSLAENTYQATKKLIHYMQKSLRVSFYFNSFIFPISLVVGGIYGYSMGAETPYFYQSKTFWMLVSSLLVAGIVLAYPLTKYYLKIFYGKHLKHLEEVVKEFESEN